MQRQEPAEYGGKTFEVQQGFILWRRNEERAYGTKISLMTA